MNGMVQRIGAHTQYWIVLLAVLMMFAVPRAVFPLYEASIELVIFISIGLVAYVLYVKKVVWIFLYFFIVLLFYNPLFLLMLDIETSPIADISIAISFFIIALNWDHILHIHSVQSK